MAYSMSEETALGHRDNLDGGDFFPTKYLVY